MPADVLKQSSGLRHSNGDIVHANGKVSHSGSTVCKTAAKQEPATEEIPLVIALVCYFSYAVLILFGHLRDLLRRSGIEKNQFAQEKERQVSCIRDGHPVT